MSAARDRFLLRALVPALAFAVAVAAPPAGDAEKSSVAVAAPPASDAEKPSVAVAAPPASDAEKAIIAGLAWLVGEWQSELGGTSTEEVWVKPTDDMLLGMHREATAAGQTAFGTPRIEVHEGKVVYLTSGELGNLVSLPLEESKGSRAVFVNPEQTYPQRISYWLADDALHARIEGDTAEGKKSREWVYRRSAD